MNFLERLKIPIVEQGVPLTNRGLSHNTVSEVFPSPVSVCLFSYGFFKGKDKFVTAHCVTVKGGSQRITPGILNVGSGRKWAESPRSGHWNPGKESAATHSVGGCVGPRGSLYILEMAHILVLSLSENLAKRHSRSSLCACKLNAS